MRFVLPSLLGLLVFPSLAAAADAPFELKLGFRIQARWDLDYSLADDAEAEHRFFIPRSRLVAEAKPFEDVKAKIQVELGGRGVTYLRDAYLDWKLGGSTAFQLRAGQWKRPFSREQIQSTAKLQFVDRSGTDRALGAGRDIGVGFHNGYEESPAGVEWAVGVFNGVSDRPRIECEADDAAPPDITCAETNGTDDAYPTAVARVGFNSSDDVDGYRPYDWTGGGPRSAVAANYRFDHGKGPVDANHYVAGDGLFKLAGWSLSGELGLVKRGEADADLVGRVQSGYFLLPKLLEVAARYASIPAADERITELTAGLNWYVEGNAFMWQADGGALISDADDSDPELFGRVQGQVIF